MTKEELAARLNGNTYGDECTHDDAAAAKAAGLVIVYGASDDLMEFEGAIHDEVGCFDGGEAWVDKDGVLDRDACDDDDALAEFVARKKSARRIEAVWGYGGYSWTYRTDIPHATFEIVEDGEPYCRGIVFALNALEAAP